MSKPNPKIVLKESISRASDRARSYIHIGIHGHPYACSREQAVKRAGFFAARAASHGRQLIELRKKKKKKGEKDGKRKSADR